MSDSGILENRGGEDSSSACPCSKQVTLDGRSFHIIKLIAEGGYSFVYLVKDGRSRGAGGNGTGGEYALKKVSL